ncbi:sulfite oxidase [Stigmatella erecta]|uniref:Mo-co oxidoreductase dimerisation domain-containing protein n=1 Tax=Stigmatella erecta TaxID=83460 RepID=A0A1I0KYU8_9BACT|nr:sulfite oxidase [Stigmatella erecta]SEU31859.1 Mo-co oxidoreductase dimerisation domain-containing protein [Stigmatella erecta]
MGPGGIGWEQLSPQDNQADERHALVTVKHAPFNAETPPAALASARTPTESFFVRSNYAEPELSRATHTVAVEGAVERPFTLKVAELARGPLRTLPVTLECAGNGRTTMTPLPVGEPWQQGALGTAVWGGVPLAQVLQQAGVKPEAVELLVEGADGEGSRRFARALPLAKALHPDTLLALEMNGAPLTRAHGAPVRLLVPGWYGMASVKWVTRLELLTRPFEGYYQRERYIYDTQEGKPPEPVTRMQVKSHITSPAEGARVAPGRVVVQGMAWSGERRVVRVEVAVNGGDSWQAATLLETPRPSAWVRWAFTWEGAPAGRHTLRARATDEAGDTQPERAPWNRLGYGNNAVQVRVVEVG